MVGGHETTEHYSSRLRVTKNDGDVEGGNAQVSIMCALISGGASFDARVFLFYTPISQARWSFGACCLIHYVELQNFGDTILA